MNEPRSERRRDYETLLEIGVQLAGTLDLTRVLELALRRAEELCRAESSSIWELDEERRELFFRLVRGQAAGYIRDVRVPLGHGIVGSVALSGEAERVNEVAGDPRWEGDVTPGFVTRSILTVPLLARGQVVGVLQLLNPVGKAGFDEEDLRRMCLFAGQLGPALHNARLYADQKRQFFETVTAFAEVIDKRDPYTGGHVRRVVSYTVLLGHELGLDQGELETLLLTAALHDVGKIAVPDEVLRKPGALGPEEARIMRRHPVDGAAIVSPIRALRELLPGIRSHHERYDGAGYPDGLSAEEIPLAARIIAVADCYDAMTTDRPYRRAHPPERAMEEIRAGSGTQFCPRVVEAFEGVYRRGAFHVEAGQRIIRSLSREPNQG